jgi:AcrR family transcriptional regulator
VSTGEAEAAAQRPPAPPRERLIKEASRLFYRNGINAVGVDAIVREASVARMTLYAQFGSKDGLIEACLDHLDGRYHDWFVDEVAAHAPDPADRLMAFFDVLDAWFRDERFRGCQFINSAVELADPAHPGHRAIMSHKRRTREYLLELALAAGVPRPHQAAEALMLIVEGATVTALVEQDKDAAHRARDAAEALLAGLAARGQEPAES